MAAEREARRPVCADCGQKFADARWEAIGCTREWSKRQSHPHLCEDCQDRAVAAEQQANFEPADAAAPEVNDGEDQPGDGETDAQGHRAVFG